MRIVVDRDLCDLHGQCVFSAPAVFRFDGAGKLEYLEEIENEQAATARTASSVCPTGAIEVLP